MGESTSTIGTNFATYSFEAFSGSTHDNHAGTLGCQAARYRGTYSTAAAGNERG
jgi:hypothetical protein